MITRDIKRQIIEIANNSPDIEVCGIIVEKDTVVKCRNSAQNPQVNFVIEPQEIEGLIPTGIYHSHCLDTQPAILSPADIANSKASKIPYILYHTIFQIWDYYDPAGIHPYPITPSLYLPKELGYYLGWRFEYNRSDCYTLIRSYYRGMLNIHIPDFPRGDIEETTDPSWDMFTANFEKAGFRILNRNEPLEKNDVILMCIAGERTHHAAILLDPNTGKALHNLGEGRVSELFMYGGYWEKATRFVCRFAG